MAQVREVEIVANTQKLEDVASALRLCLSQIGFALDGLLVELHRISNEEDG